MSDKVSYLVTQGADKIDPIAVANNFKKIVVGNVDILQHLGVGWEDFIHYDEYPLCIDGWKQSTKDGFFFTLHLVIKDTTVEELIGVQSDYEFRRKYMLNTTEMYVVESQTKENGDKTEVLYWRIKIPYMILLSEREYIFKRRRFKIDDICILIDEGLDSCPLVKDNSSYYRVKSYDRSMALAPSSRYENSVEVLVEFLSPVDIGIPIPSWMMNWLAGAGLKLFVGNGLESLEKYKKYLKEKKEQEEKQTH